MYKIIETKEYAAWFNQQTIKEQGQIQARIAKIRIDHHFGTVKKLSEDN